MFDLMSYVYYVPRHETIIPVKDLIVKWEMVDLNHRPFDYQSNALPLS